MKQIPLPITPPPDRAFDALLIGPNVQAVQHLRGLGAGGIATAPVYLWGAAGTGKTRLLQALAARLQSEGERVGWFDPATAPPWSFDERWAAVIVDGCESLDAQRQQAAFALFVDAVHHGVQWVAAGALPPVDLPLRDDLRSRLGWGQVFALQALREDETRAALRREADRRGILLSDEVMHHLLTRFERNLGHLMALLDRLDRFALAEQRAVTVPLLKKMLDEESAVEESAALPADNPGEGVAR